MLLKWNEREQKQIGLMRVSYKIPVEGKVIVTVAKRALTDKIAQEGLTVYDFRRGDGFVKVYATAIRSVSPVEIPVGNLDDFEKYGM